MNMTRIMATVVAAVLVLSPVEGAAASKMKLGTVAPTGSPWIESLENMKKLVEKDSAGGLKVQIFPSGQLGDEIQMVEGAQFGSIECAGISTGALATIMPSLNVFELPFEWESREEAYYILDNYFRSYFDKELQKIGFQMIAWSENGWRHFHTKGKAIRTPADLQGLKLRSQENKVHLAFWRALGVSPITLPMTEIYQAMERGIIDGGENTLVLTAATGWAEVIKHVSLTGHIYQPAVLVCNKGWFDAQPQTSRDALMKNTGNIEADMRARLLKAEGELVDTFKKQYGIAVLDLRDAAQIKPFVEKTKGVRSDPEIRKLIGENVMGILDKAKAEYRSKKK